jgi:hypothetical protein
MLARVKPPPKLRSCPVHLWSLPPTMEPSTK